MSSIQEVDKGASTVASPGSNSPTQDAVFEVLSNARRREVIRALREREEVPLGQLAEQVAAWENDTTVQGVTYDQRKRVYTALQQSHLPKMDEAGAVQFDKDRGTVEPAQDIAEFDIYLEVVPGTELPRSEYYVALGAVGLALAAVVAMHVYPFTLVADLAWAAMPVVAFGLSSLVHLYVTRSATGRGTDREGDE